MRVFVRSAAVAAASLAASVASLGAQRAMQPNDWHRVTTLAAPAISPDGRTVAFTVTTVNESQNRRHSEVWVVPAAGGEAMRYTSAGYESSNPRFTYDGKYLQFTSQRPGGQGSTWAIRMDGPSGEATQLPTTSYPTGSAPANNAFVVTTTGGGGGFGFGGGGFPGGGQQGGQGEGGRMNPNDPFARMPATARPPYGSITRPVDPSRFDGRHITAERFKANGQGFVASPYTAPAPQRTGQLVVQSLDGKRDTITRAAYSHRSPVVSPDGKVIAFLADPWLRPDSVVTAINDSVSKLPYDRARADALTNTADIYVMPIAGGTPRKVVELMGTENQLTWSPDGKKLAFLASEGRTAQTVLKVVDVATGAVTNLTPDWRYEPAGIRWFTAGEILMWGDIGGSSALYGVNARTGARREILGGRRKVRDFSFDATGKTVAYVSTSVNKPTEIYVAAVDGRTPERKLTSFNDALNAEVAWSDAERITFKSVGDMEIEGWLMKPYGYQPGQKYPLVLYVHGGPHSQYGEQWFDETQNLAAEGYWVLYTNPRGSSGYGAAFTYSTRGRWFAEDYQDLMKAVDLVAARPEVDSTKMGVTGGSYGGVMTAWITTQTNRFKAAQTDRMISNWWSWYGSSDAQGLTEFEFFGTPWDNPAMYDSLSPIRYIKNVKTPTFVLQSEEDHRTPITDAEQWFLGLKKQGTPAEFVRYPRSTHDLSRTGEPWLLVDRLGRLRDWFNYWLKGQGPRTVAPPTQAGDGAGAGAGGPGRGPGGRP